MKYNNTFVHGKIIILLFISLCLFSRSNAQVNFPLNHQWAEIIEKDLNDTSNWAHTSFRPFIYQQVQKSINLDSIYGQFKREKTAHLLGKTWWSKALIWADKAIFDESVISIAKDGCLIKINPLMDLAYGTTVGGKNITTTNTRGFSIEGKIGSKLFFTSSFLESQSKFLPYVKDFIVANNGVVPGQGRSKSFKTNQGYDYGRAAGLVSYSPSKYFNFQLGHDKIFIGDGYRSLLLSDNGFNQPLIKITTKFWHIEYVNLFTQFQQVGFIGQLDALIPKKYGNFHYLSWNVTKRWNISLFEAIISAASNNRMYEFQYLNPVIFLRPVEFANGSGDNALMGATSKIKLGHNTILYGQILLDEFNIQKLKEAPGWWGHKFGVQLGLKAFDLFTIKNLNLQLEANVVRPYTYSHYGDSATAKYSSSNFTTYNQSLAHPLGANFAEGLAFLNYHKKRFFFESRVSYALYGADSAGINYGQNVNLSYNYNRAKISGDLGDFGHTIGQGIQNTLLYTDLKVAYLINPSTNLRIEFGWMTRQQVSSIINSNVSYLYFGMRCALFNHNYDF